MARPPKKTKSTPQRRVLCRCNCGHRVTQSMERRHRAGKAAPHVLAAAITRRHELGQDSDDSNGYTSTDAFKRSAGEPNQSEDEMSPSSDTLSVISNDGGHIPAPAVIQDAASAAALVDNPPSHVDHNSSPRHNPIDLEERPSCLLDADDQEILRDANIHLDDAVDPRTWRRTTVEDYDSDDSDDEDPEPESDIFEWEAELGDLYDVPPDELSDEDILPGNTMEEEYECLLAAFQEDLTDEDLALLRQFAFKVEERISDESYEKLSFVFPGTTIYPFKVARARAAFLAEFRPVPYDCCINSCCCYTGSLSKLNVCPYCGEDRFDSLDRPRKRFNYVPLIPRLQAYYRNKKLAEQMMYRHQHRHDPNNVNDVFSGRHYAQLRTTHVNVNGVERPYMYFSDRRDLLLGMSTDGFAPFRRRKKTCWPLIIFNYNLPPEIRFHLINILCIGVIPGPKKPKDFDSFAWPLVEELLQLSLGVRSFDVLSNEVFALRAYLVLVFGDIPAVSMVMRIKGHNGVHPCRMCKIRGLRIPDARSTVHYVPLHRANHPDVRDKSIPNAVAIYDPTSLPLRSHREMVQQAREVQFAESQAASDRLSIASGIKGTSLLMHLGSISFPISFPYDFMHLIFENVMPNLIRLWTRSYKGLDEGTGDYELDKKVWEAVGAATASSGSHIPSAFAARPPNLADDRTAITADSTSFWMQYIGPVLLQRKFRKEIYYAHFIEFVRLVRLCLQFEITSEEVQEIREGFSKWVQKYEKLYYQFAPDRLATCPLTIHGLLHIADGIVEMGPVWTYWAFPMERYCGKLQRGIKSRRFPFASLDNFVLYHAQLSHIKTLYALEDQLSLSHRRDTSVAGQLSHPDYPTCILLPPKRASKFTTAPLVEKILISLATRYDTNIRAIRPLVNVDRISQWACVRRLEGGDDMRALALYPKTSDRRDATFIRYEMLVDINAHRPRARSVFQPKTFYGQLENIFVVHISPSRTLSIAAETTLILAGVRQCNVTTSSTATSVSIQYYSDMGPYEVIDMACVQCLIGRIPVGKKWAIVDRSESLNYAVFTDDK